MFKVLDPRVKSNAVCDKFANTILSAALIICVYGLIGTFVKSSVIECDALIAATGLLIITSEFKPIRPKF